MDMYLSKKTSPKTEGANFTAVITVASDTFIAIMVTDFQLIAT